MTLNRRVLYMLPTPHGLTFAVALLGMLLIAVNYNNGLAYAFVFLIGALAIVSMIFTHRNVTGLTLSVSDADPVFAGETASFRVSISNPAAYGRDALWLISGQYKTETGAPPQGAVELDLPVKMETRGYSSPPPFRISSAFPFGLLYTWSTAVAGGGARALAYPKPEGRRDLPLTAFSARFLESTKRHEGDDFIGLRDYQPSDPPRHIHWKAVAAKQQWFTKQFGGGDSEELWLDWDQVHGGTEQRLSQLCLWITEADRQGFTYGLRMPGLTIDMNCGIRHRHRCLKTLALWGVGGGTEGAATA